jgi:Zn finger protein HypA/HybF involved in hydrogenase expression
MNRDRFENWLRNIFETQDEEISCTECFDLVSRFVELEVSGQDAAAKMPQVKQHLDQCPACRSEYETLRDLRRQEEQGGMPSRDDLQDLIH